jgi:tetratricopeptide (TPR) repeat protein
MKLALDRSTEGHSHLLPVLLRPCDWRSTPLARFQALPGGGKPVTQWSSRSSALRDVIGGLRSVLAQTPPPPISRVDDGLPAGEQDIRPAIWNIPFGRDTGFVGRTPELVELQAALGKAEAQGRPVIVTGLAGVGKTAMAIEYAYRFGSNYSAVWWIRADHEETLAIDLAALVPALGLTPGRDADQRHMIELAKDWLARNRGWLLICDDVQNPDILESLPTSSTGGILATSRLLSWRSRVELFSLLPLSTSDGQLLLARAGVENHELAGRLAAELGGHPLALRLAASHLHRTGDASSNWMVQLDTSFRKRELAPPIESALRIIVNELPRRSPEAYSILSLSSFLAPAPFPEHAFREKYEDLLAEQSKGAERQESLPIAIDDLVDLSLIERSGKFLKFHALVQDLIRSNLAPEARDAWAAAALYLTTRAFPEAPTEPSNWDTCSQFLPHAYSTLEHAKQLQVGLDGLVVLLRKVGLYFGSKGEFADAQNAFHEALGNVDKTKLRGTLINALLHQHIGGVCESLHDLPGAADSYHRALAMGESAPDSEPVAVIFLLEALSRVLARLGQFESSGRFAERGIELATKTLGSDHEVLGRLLSQWAGTLRSMGRLAEAQHALEQAVRISEASLGPSRAQMSCLNSLGIVLGEQRDFEAARKCFDRAIQIARRNEDSASLAMILNNLGTTFQDSGDQDDAIRCFLESLRINQSLERRDPQTTGLALRNLGQAYLRRGDYSSATELLTQALQMLEGAFGPTHPICRDISSHLTQAQEMRR